MPLLTDLRAAITSSDLTKTAIAASADISRANLDRILKGSDCTVGVAERVANAIGVELAINRQNARHRHHHKEKQ